MALRNQTPRDIDELLRQERAYMDDQIGQVRQEFDEKLERRAFAAGGQKDVFKNNSVRGDGPTATPAVSNTKKLAQLYQKPAAAAPANETPKPRILAASRDSQDPWDNRQSVVSWSQPLFENGKSGRRAVYESTIVQVPPELRHLDWNQATMAGNWRPTDAEGIHLMKEIAPHVHEMDAVEGEYIATADLIRGAGQGADNEGAPVPWGPKEKVTIAQEEKKVIPKSNSNSNRQDGQGQTTTTKLSTSLSEPKMFESSKTNEDERLERELTIEKFRINQKEANKEYYLRN